MHTEWGHIMELLTHSHECFDGRKADFEFGRPVVKDIEVYIHS